MAVESKTATNLTADPSVNGYAKSVKNQPFTVEVSAAASVSSSYTLGYAPTSARFGGLARLYWDDMATSGSPTLDIGVGGTSFTFDDDKLNDGLDLATVNTTSGVRLIKDIANQHKRLWELAGLTSDPGEVWVIKGVIRDAAVIAGGTLSGDLAYTTD
ncbi:MAG TPA: hypothetical protein VJM31_00020 [Vicinamibacterales bacterium]|nr:hypothetical protein [Vicinamibacterales bacterium]